LNLSFAVAAHGSCCHALLLLALIFLAASLPQQCFLSVVQENPIEISGNWFSLPCAASSMDTDMADFCIGLLLLMV
jgi:hypothetical protein